MPEFQDYVDIDKFDLVASALTSTGFARQRGLIPITALVVTEMQLESKDAFRLFYMDYSAIKKMVIESGYRDEILWAENIKCRHSADFFAEYVWVVISSGMKNQIAKKIYMKVMAAIIDRVPVNTVFRHWAKVRAINHVLANQRELYLEYLMDNDKLAWLEARLPHIGPITKYHLAKNLGLDVCKPDRHLVRIANGYGLTPQELCTKLANETGSKVAVVDQVLWRAANLGIV